MWSAKVLLEEPDLVEDVHYDYILAGAKVITLNNYSCTPERLERDGSLDMFKKLQGIMGVDAVEENLEEFIKKKELVVQQQKPKIDVLNNIAMRSDNKPFPLSWNAGKGEISVGGKVFVDSSNAKKFVSFFDRNEDKQEAMLKALQSASTTAKLFDLLGLKYKLDMER